MRGCCYCETGPGRQDMIQMISIAKEWQAFLTIFVDGFGHPGGLTPPRDLSPMRRGHFVLDAPGGKVDGIVGGNAARVTTNEVGGTRE